MEKPLFTIIFKDNSHYVGNTSYFDTGWLGITPNKPIKRIFYKLPNEDCICLDGYEKYFRMSEACKDLNGKQKGKVKIQYDYIMGLKKDEVTCYRITLHEDKDARYKKGDITIRIFNINDKFIKGLNPDNWRG